MKAKYVILGIIDLAVWYFFAYYILYVLQNSSSYVMATGSNYLLNAWVAALILVVLGAVGTVLCPWFQNTDGWEKMLHGGH